jgi:hypothetical protein
MRLLILALSLWPLMCSADESLECTRGDLSKVYGNLQWQLRGCSDGQSVIVMSVAGNAADPYFFLLRPAGDKITVAAQGSGDASAAAPARAELERMQARDLAVLARGLAAAAGN